MSACAIHMPASKNALTTEAASTPHQWGLHPLRHNKPTYSYELLKGVDLSSSGGLTEALEEGEEVAREEGIELEEEVVDWHIQVKHQLLWGEAWRGQSQHGTRNFHM